MLRAEAVQDLVESIRVVGGGGTWEDPGLKPVREEEGGGAGPSSPVILNDRQREIQRTNYQRRIEPSREQQAR